MTAPRDRARQALSEAVRARDEARREYEATDGALRQAIRDAEAVGVTLVEIAETTGLHRNTVRTIVRGEGGSPRE
ncbi:hypothetical protein [Actinomycetospora sp. CA-053990]|uniref:hypothetical protein n=1 Tax=Actinomycetospora sp. CA-053990 TaxID=3239891 RepID=UPI003D8D52A5